MDVDDLLAGVRLAVPGLHRTHPERNLTAIAGAILDAYRGGGPVRLGRARRLAVIAVDGFGYRSAAAALQPDVLVPLTSEFPTTTVGCLLASVTGRRTDEHGFVGVQYLHDDGRRTVNCFDGGLDEPTSEVPPRPTVTPAFRTVFDTLAHHGVSSVALPNELAYLSPDVRAHLLSGADATAVPLPRFDDPVRLTDAFATQLSAAVGTRDNALTWAYLDFDTYLHGHGFDTSIDAAGRALDALARRLGEAGTAVLMFSDHGLVPNRPGAGTLDVWREATDPSLCRLPAGGAGRVRWLYPHAGYGDRLAAWLADQLPDAVVTSPARLADWGLVAAGSIGQRRLGEIVLLARGPDFPAPDAAVGYEHGSTTAEEMAVPMAIWQPAH